MRNEKFLCANSSAHFNYYAKNKGFTLSELLMSVLVISIIMVAMAPVITKRVSDNISVADVKYDGMLFEYNTFAQSCSLGEELTSENPLCCDIVEGVYGSSYNQCEYLLPDGVKNINVASISGGGGGGGGVPADYRIVYQKIGDDACHKYTFSPDAIYKDVKVYNMRSTGGTGGGGMGRVGGQRGKAPGTVLEWV